MRRRRAEGFEGDIDEERELPAGGSGPGRTKKPTVRGELASIMREAAIEVLGPVARTATTRAAKYAVKSGPSLAKNTIGPRVKDTLGPRIEEAGGAGALAKSALTSVSGARGGVLAKVGIGGHAQEGARGGRRLPVHESVDVAVPLETAYNQFTQFEDFPKFMHRVAKVEQEDDAHLSWHERVWGITRVWEIEITDQQPNERIAWKSVSGSGATGVVTFHRLSGRLTRIEVIADLQPQGVLEKTASVLQVSRRTLRSDLTRFKAFIELREDDTGAWGERIEDAEVAEGDGKPRDRDRTRVDRTRAGRPRADRTRRRGGRRRPAREFEDEDEPQHEHEDEEQYEPEDEEDFEPEDEDYDDEGYDEEEEPEASEEDDEFDEQEEPEEEEEEEPEEERVARKSRVRRRPPARPTRSTRGRR